MEPIQINTNKDDIVSVLRDDDKVMLTINVNGGTAYTFLTIEEAKEVAQAISEAAERG